MTYVSLDSWRFALGLAVVSVPALLLDEGGEKELAYSYTALILLMLLLANVAGVEAFSAFLRRELGRS